MGEKISPFICVCILDDGKMMPYDIAVDADFFEKRDILLHSGFTRNYNFLGEGYIYSVDGVIQNLEFQKEHNQKCLFYERKYL